MRFEAEAMEFPAFADMPKREKSKLAKVWETFQAMSKIVEEKGMLVPQTFAAKVLGISKQRVGVLADAGKIEAIEFNGTRFITEQSLIAHAKTERKAGRPLKLPATYGEAMKFGMDHAKGK
jgi:hypothetical protein